MTHETVLPDADFASLEERIAANLAAEGKKYCPYCGGLGWVAVDVGQLFECMPCNNTGFVSN